mgnify:CR=1 FL=1
MLSFNPHELKKLLKRYGVEVEELRGVERVELFMGHKKIVITSPQVVAFKVPGHTIYQITGNEVREETTPYPAEQPVEQRIAISEDDVKFIMEYTGVTRDKAVDALVKAKGDLARAIMILRGEEK